MRSLAILLLFASSAFAQSTAKPAQSPSKPSQSAQKPAAPSPSEPAAAEVAPSATVITLNGYCPGKQATGEACKTEITREQFDNLAKALQVPENRKSELANAYSQVLVLGGAAERRGLTKNSGDEAILNFVRLQTLAQLLARDLRNEAANIPQPEIQKYYDDHKDQFAQATLQRIFIPKSTASDKEKPSDATLKAEADKIGAAAKQPDADFTKLQKQAYDDLKISSSPPPVELRDMRHDSLPPDQQQQVFSLAPGSVTPPIDEAAAFYIYKLVSKDVQPLTQVEAEVKRNVEQERFQASMEKILTSVKPQLNPAYFGAAAAGRPGPTLGVPPVTPGASPASKAPATAPKGSSSPPKK